MLVSSEGASGMCLLGGTAMTKSFVFYFSSHEICWYSNVAKS